MRCSRVLEELYDAPRSPITPTVCGYTDEPLLGGVVKFSRGLSAVSGFPHLHRQSPPSAKCLTYFAGTTVRMYRVGIVTPMQSYSCCCFGCMTVSKTRFQTSLPAIHSVSVHDLSQVPGRIAGCRIGMLNVHDWMAFMHARPMPRRGAAEPFRFPYPCHISGSAHLYTLAWTIV